METAAPRVIRGHTHTPEIMRNVFTVGTSSRFDLDYNKGQASKWMHTHGFLWQYGIPQLINVIDGQWYVKEER